MKKLLSCEFNIDTACVELRYAGGETLSIYTPGIEDSFVTTPAMRTELDWLAYNAPLRVRKDDAGRNAGGLSKARRGDAWAGGLKLNKASGRRLRPDALFGNFLDSSNNHK